MACLLRVALNPTFERSTVSSDRENPETILSLYCKASSFKSKTMSHSSVPREKLRRKCREKKEDEEPLGGDMEDLFSEKETQKIRMALLDWYNANKRDLPWRKRRSEGEKERRAYEVWVSEIMLQQTRVQTVMEYYKRWMLKWPTIHHLAQASLEEVNEVWAGLGYYRRARFLLEGAKMVVEGKDGFPNQASSLMKVKGIGEYTAGAIASIAFHEVVPVVDGNVIRVLARLKAISANPKDRITAKNFWKLAAQLVDPSNPGDFNQSLMELGSTLCTLANPSCSSCPVSSQCRAYLLFQNIGIPVTDYPTKVVKTKQKRDFCCMCVLEILNQERNQSGGIFVLVKRPEEGLLAGLWEFPSVILDEEADLETRRKAIDLYLRKALHVEPNKTCTIVSRKELGEFMHIFTHIRRKVYAELLVVQLTEGGTNDLFRDQANNSLSLKCVDSEVLSTMGLSSAVRKVYSMVEAHKQGLSVAPVSSNRRAMSRKRRIS